MRKPVLKSVGAFVQQSNGITKRMTSVSVSLCSQLINSTNADRQPSKQDRNRYR